MPSDHLFELLGLAPLSPLLFPASYHFPPKQVPSLLNLEQLELSIDDLGYFLGLPWLLMLMRTRDAARKAGVNFVPQPAVRWFAPGVLVRAGFRVLIGGVFGSYLDKRELQDSRPGPSITRHSGEDEIWIDFIADSGDSFDAVYSIAWLASRETLDIEGVNKALPRAQLLILGGDQVYPSAGQGAYSDRLTGPYRSALPFLADDEAPSFIAVAGNHDWHDGLTSFIRTFTDRRWMGAWRGVQCRSYAAVQLPHDWWLWTIDLQKGFDLDEPQQRYFEKVASDLMPLNAKVILCVADPAWVDAASDPQAYKALDYLERKLLKPVGARVVLTLTGDSHHYAHYVGDDGTHKITAGGGGAFLHPTHDLPEVLTLKSPTPGPSSSPITSSVTYELDDRCYPSKRASRAMTFGALGMAIRNPSFLIITGLLHLVFLMTNRVALTDLAGKVAVNLDKRASTLGLFDLGTGLLRSPACLVVLVIMTSLLVAFAKPPSRVQKGRGYMAAKMTMGIFHSAGHVLAVLLVELLAVDVSGRLASGHWFTVLLIVMVAGIGSVVGSLVMGAYLTLSCLLLNTHGNETFSCQRLTRYKCFVRLHIASDGELTVYPLGVDRVWKKWRPGNHQPGVPNLGEAMLVPDSSGSTVGPKVHLIEKPFVIKF